MCTIFLNVWEMVLWLGQSMSKYKVGDVIYSKHDRRLWKVIEVNETHLLLNIRDQDRPESTNWEYGPMRFPINVIDIMFVHGSLINIIYGD